MMIRKRAVSNCSWENVNEAELDLRRLNKAALFQKDTRSASRRRDRNPYPGKLQGAKILSQTTIHDTWEKGEKGWSHLLFIAINVSRTYTYILDLDTSNNLSESYFMTTGILKNEFQEWPTQIISYSSNNNLTEINTKLKFFNIILKKEKKEEKEKERT